MIVPRRFVRAGVPPLAVAATLLAGRAIAQENASAPPALTVQAPSGQIRLDGILDEPDWDRAAVIPDLAQQSPRPGEPTRFRTVVRILADSRNLYFGVSCFDPDPGRIAIHTMQRDGSMKGDDTVSIVLDTFHDRRTGYLFEVNAAGARLDGLISDPNVSDVPLDWDGIWDVRTSRSAEGWTAEIVIPAETLRFRSGSGPWGFNVERYVPHALVTLRWSGVSLDAHLTDMRRAGELTGLDGLEQGLGLSVSPYLLGKYTIDHLTGHDVLQGQGGGEISYNLSSQLTGVLTINPDFAEVEADTRQINLTRFPLFFPEKRPFFTEGASFFDFGLDLQDTFIPFYSRRVGLFDGRIIPITAGLKAVGRSGPWGVGVLDVQTRDEDGAEGTNQFAGRVTYDVDRHLRVGAIGTSGSPDGRSDNSLAGVDAVWQSSTFLGDKNLALAAWGARSFGDLPEGRRGGWGVKASYPNDLWDLEASVKEFGEALDPALGFLPRPGTREYAGGIAYQPRPDGGAFSGIRQFFFECFPRVVTDLHGETQTWRVFIAPFNVETVNGDHFEANYAPEFERLDAPFEVAPGVVIPAGSYQFNRYRVQVDSSTSRPLSASGLVWFGQFYGGNLTQLITSLRWTTDRGHLQLGLDTENDFGYLPQGNFTVRLWQLRTAYAFDPDLILSTYAQYDSESGDLGLNARLRWTIEPGRDLFVVWNRAWTHHPTPPSTAWVVPTGDQVVVKLRWTFRR